MILKFEIQDAEFLSVADMKADSFQTPSAEGRFVFGVANEASSTGELFHSEKFADGTVFWYETRVDALLASKIYEESGFPSVILLDTRQDEGEPVHVVLTTWEPSAAFRTVEFLIQAWGDVKSVSNNVNKFLNLNDFPDISVDYTNDIVHVKIKFNGDDDDLENKRRYLADMLDTTVDVKTF